MLYTIITSIKDQSRTIALQGFAAVCLMTGILATLLPSYNAGLWLAMAGQLAVAASYFWMQTTLPGYVGKEARKLYGDQLFYSSPGPSTKRTPWQFQAELMRMSDQEMPAEPTLTNGSLLYSALIMEESAETFAALYKVLDAHLIAMYELYDLHERQTDPNFVPLLRIRAELAGVKGNLAKASELIRTQVADCSPLAVKLTPVDAQELLDGTTDIAVVNCGFALATGLPGEEGYDEVGESNLSKANPATGKIDKDPGGKWIKGANYHKPDLASVLKLHAARVRMAEEGKSA